jgi:hypothetical protein
MVKNNLGKKAENSGSGNGWKIALGVAVIGASATVIAALITSASGDRNPSAPNLTTPPMASTCQGTDAAKVSPSLADDEVNIRIAILCPPPPNVRYILIAQVRDEDVDPNNPHPEYKLVWELPQLGVGTYQRSHVDGYIQAGAQLTYYLISLDDIGYAELQANRYQGKNFVVELSKNYTIVSNRETVQKQ